MALMKMNVALDRTHTVRRREGKGERGFAAKGECGKKPKGAAHGGWRARLEDHPTEGRGIEHHRAGCASSAGLGAPGGRPRSDSREEMSPEGAG